MPKPSTTNEAIKINDPTSKLSVSLTNSPEVYDKMPKSSV
jgi:hypothetical protein